MKYLILMTLFSFNLWAQTKAPYFPKLIGGQVIEEREFKDKMEVSLEKGNGVYRQLVNYKDMRKISGKVAIPVHTLAQYSVCSKTDLAVQVVFLHTEKTYVESRFKCLNKKDYDPVKERQNLKSRYCGDFNIVSETQEKLCKELLLR